MLGIKTTGILGVALALALAAAPGASAGVATYNSTAPVHVTNDNEPNGVTSKITVPAGRTAVQSVELTNFTVFWAASAQEMSARVEGTDGTPVQLFNEGCFSYETADVWAFSDTAPIATWNDKNDPKCDLPGGALRPLGKLSAFAGKQATGTWTLRAIDSANEGFNNQGSIQTWALRITHAPPTLAAGPPKSADLDKKLKVLVTADADGTAAAGAAKSNLKAGQQAAIPFKVSKKLRKRIEDKGKSRVKVKVAFTDETGGTANATVPVKVTD
jgi:hypothetical protein